MKRFFKSTYYTAVILLFLLIAAGGLTQTKTFRSALRNFALGELRTIVNGTIDFGAIEGNLATGLQINNVVLARDGREILYAERLEATYDLGAFLIDRVSIHRLTLVNARIHLWRGLDGRWNVDDLFIASEEPDSTSASTVDLRQIELVAARVELIDSLALANRTTEEAAQRRPESVDYARVSLFPFSLRAGLHVSEAGTILAIRSLEFESRQPRFHLAELSGEFHLRPQSTEARSVKIRTDRSQLAVDARLKGRDATAIGHISELESSPVELTLNVDRLDVNEFKQFLAGPVDFLDGTLSFDVKAAGPFGNLSIAEVAVRTPRTFLRIGGSIRNLHRSEALELDLSARDNVIHPADLAEFLPGLDLPDLTPIGVLSCDYSYRGTPQQFHGLVRGRIAAGDFHVEGDLDLTGRQPAYDATITTTGLDPGVILDSPAFRGSLNTRATVSGAGTSLQTMTTVIRVQADSSMMLDQPLSNSIIVADVADNSLRSNVLINLGTMRADLSSRASFAADSLKYSVDGTVNSLDLATWLGERRHASDLSFSVNVRGTGLDPRSMSMEAGLHFLRSTYADDEFEDQSVSLAYHGAPESRTMSLNSTPLDIQVEGRFTPAAVVGLAEHAGTLLVGAVAHRFATFDSLRTQQGQSPRKPFRLRALTVRDTIEAAVVVTARDLYPLGSLLGEPLFGQATVRTDIRGSAAQLSLTGTFQTGQFLFAGAPSVDIGTTELAFSLANLLPENTLENVVSDIRLRTARLLIDSTLITDLSFNHSLSSDTSIYSASAVLDSAVSIAFEGTSGFVPNKLDLRIPTLRLRIADHDFENPEPLHLWYGRDGLLLESFSLQHEAEEVTLSGLFDPGGVSDLSFNVRNFLLNNLREFSRDPAYVDRVRSFNGVLDLSGLFQGDLDNPEFEVSMKAQGVTIGETLFGQITGRSTYRQGAADLFVEFMSRPNEQGAVPELFVSGVMPLGSSRSAPQADQAMNLTLRSRAFRLEFLDPFISVTSRLKGAVTGDVSMKGTLASPLYDGSLSFENTEFLFEPLGITYRLAGNLIPDGTTFRLEGVSLTNIPEDRVPGLVDGLGTMNFGGRFTLEGVLVRQFDISALGQLLVMKETARLPGLPLYGNIYAGTGAKELRWFGTPERSFVAGDLLIKNATMTFPPTRDLLLERARMVTVDFIDDTSHAVNLLDTDGGRSLALANGGPTPPSRREPRPLTGEDPGSGSFLDHIVYNLTVETAGLTQVRFVFNPLTNEELFADLKGRLVFTKDEAGSRVTGELEVGQRSYYRYFKTLQATGKLLFTGDISNPELDIDATYEGTYLPADTTLAGQKVIVRLDITGTRSEPKVTMGLDVFDRDGNRLPRRADVQSDAIAFLVSGTFKDDMTQGEQRNLLATSLLGSIGSSLLSGPLTDLVRNQVGYITSIDVYYYGGANRTFGESADIRLTGEVGDAVIRLGGRVLEDLRNTNVSIQFPMSSITGSDAWRNLILELERRSEGMESFEQRRSSNGLRLLYRISF